jgi:thymidylate synthase
MQVLEVRNVHDALVRGMDFLVGDSYKDESRNGTVYRAKTPVTTVYKRPAERVLFWHERDANPFFHFMEGLWMLTGRNDLGFVHYYNKGMEKYSDDGESLHGAYGWRWRDYFTIDQLQVIIQRLSQDPDDRRSVLQMWDPIGDLAREGKDVPCNTCIYFSTDRSGCLQMTVSNRSNDIVWGAYGANAVHMSMLQEYMASAIGRPVGTYYQVSNNYHAYEEVFEKLMKKFGERDAFDFYTLGRLINENPYKIGEVQPYPMVNTDIRIWDKDLVEFLDRTPFNEGEFNDRFFNEVAVPMQDSWWLHKSGKTEEAMIEIQKCAASDWRKACWEWFNRRVK